MIEIEAVLRKADGTLISQETVQCPIELQFIAGEQKTEVKGNGNNMQ